MSLCCFKCWKDLGPRNICVKIARVDEAKSLSNASDGLLGNTYQILSPKSIYISDYHVFMCIDCLEEFAPGIKKQLGPENMAKTEDIERTELEAEKKLKVTINEQVESSRTRPEQVVRPSWGIWMKKNKESTKKTKDTLVLWNETIITSKKSKFHRPSASQVKETDDYYQCPQNGCRFENKHDIREKCVACPRVLSARLNLKFKKFKDNRAFLIYAIEQKRFIPAIF